MKKIDDMINDVLDEVMSKATRMKKARMMKMKGKMIAKKRKIAMKRKASPEKLKSKAMKKARDIIAKKILKDKIQYHQSAMDPDHHLPASMGLP